jgi:2,3-dihydroxybenzoate-AMP ligase
MTSVDFDMPTPDALARHAAQSPDRIAVSDCGSSVPYARFHRDVLKTTAAMRRFGLRPGDTVAIEFSGLYRPWLLQLACERLGVATLHFPPGPLTSDLAALLADTAMTFFTRDTPSDRPGHHADDTWWRSVDAGEADTEPTVTDPEAVLRIACSSGTTGRVKLIPQTAGQLAARSQRYSEILGIDAQTRYLVGMGFSVQIEHLLASACLRAGGTVLYAGEVTPADAIEQVRPTHLCLMPLHINALLKSEKKIDAVPGATLCVVGGHVSQRGRQALQQVLDHRLVEVYATNETSGIAVLDGDSRGRPLPGVTVSVVDEDDQPVSDGTQGHIRIQSDSVSDGYLNADETDPRFRDGWFYPGDLAINEGDGTFRLIGRDDALVNIRGLKLNAPDIEDALHATPTIRDAALTVIATEDAGEQLAVAIVPDEDFKPQQIQAQLAPLLQPEIGPIVLIKVSAIPRTSSGKIQRHRLADLLERNRHA